MLNLIIVKNNIVKKILLETIQAVRAVITIKKDLDTKFKIILRNLSTKIKQNKSKKKKTMKKNLMKITFLRNKKLKIIHIVIRQPSLELKNLNLQKIINRDQTSIKKRIAFLKKSQIITLTLE